MPLMCAILKTGGREGDPYFEKCSKLNAEGPGLLYGGEAMACPRGDDRRDKLEHNFPIVSPS